MDQPTELLDSPDRETLREKPTEELFRDDKPLDDHDDKPLADDVGRSHPHMNKLKRALHLGKDRSKDISTVPTSDDVQAAFEETSASRRLDPDSAPEQSSSKTHDLLHSPIDTTKSLVRGRVAEEMSANLLVTEVPHYHNVELIQSHDAVLRAKSSSERLAAVDRREVLLKAQQNELVLWTMNRHVLRVKVMSDPPPAKSRRDYQVVEESGKSRTDWKGFAGHLLDHAAHRYGSNYVGYGTYPPPLSKDVLTSIAERILVVSIPLQHLALRLADVYRWKDPLETLTYLSAYLILWAMGIMVPALLFGTLYLVILRHNKSQTLEDLRRETQRIEDMSARSRSFAEFASKQSTSDWLTPLADILGPSLLIQLGDVASLFEILQNFYEWRTPKRTARALVILAILGVITAVTPTWLLVKATTLSIGLVFFLLFPISSHYPDYRLLVSPKTWLFWKIPTHAEWAIAIIQNQGIRGKKRATSESGPIEIARHACMSTNHKGGLVISDQGIRFVTLLNPEDRWNLPYSSILRIEKVSRLTHSGSGLDLKISTADGTDYVTRNVVGRDEAFAQIIGYADVTWLPEW